MSEEFPIEFDEKHSIYLEGHYNMNLVIAATGTYDLVYVDAYENAVTLTFDCTGCMEEFLESYVDERSEEKWHFEAPTVTITLNPCHVPVFASVLETNPKVKEFAVDELQDNPTGRVKLPTIKDALEFLACYNDIIEQLVEEEIDA